MIYTLLLEIPKYKMIILYIRKNIYDILYMVYMTDILEVVIYYDLYYYFYTGLI